MPQKLTITQVQNIAKLARLDLNGQETEKFSLQLSSILNYFDQLQEVNTENIEPTSQVAGLRNMTREDFVEQDEIQDELIKCAPESEGSFIKVRNIL